jgi:hypothetical protein
MAKYFVGTTKTETDSSSLLYGDAHPSRYLKIFRLQKIC